MQTLKFWKSEKDDKHVGLGHFFRDGLIYMEIRCLVSLISSFMVRELVKRFILSCIYVVYGYVMPRNINLMGRHRFDGKMMGRLRNKSCNIS